MSKKRVKLGRSHQDVLVLLEEALADWEPLPGALVVELPDVGLLSSVVRLILVYQVQEEEPANS